MRLLKAAATAIIIAGALGLLWRYTVIPYRCNVRVAQATHDLTVLTAMATDSVYAPKIARVTIEQMLPCALDCPGNISAQMVLAAGYRAVGLNRQAAAVYETALRYDRRPELYFNLGQTQLALGDSKEALQNLVFACICNPTYLDEIGLYHPEVKQAVDEYQIRLMQQRH